MGLMFVEPGGVEGVIGKNSFLPVPDEVDIVLMREISMFANRRQFEAFLGHVSRSLHNYARIRANTEGLDLEETARYYVERRGWADIAFIRFPIPGNPTEPLRAEAALDRIMEDGGNWVYKGWYEKPGEVSETDGLLDEFLQLSKLPKANTEEIMTQRVERFAGKWGPLWQCIIHEDCLCSDAMSRPDPCLWYPLEMVNNFYVEARVADSVLSAAAYLKRGKAAPSRILVDIEEHYPGGNTNQFAEMSPEDGVMRWQYHIITRAIRERLTIIGPLVDFEWHEEGQTTLRLNTGLGFLRIVWLQIAQRIAGGRYPCQCANPACGKYFFREEKPRPGEDVFCGNELCKKARKALYMQRVRSGQPKRRKISHS